MGRYRPDWDTYFLTLAMVASQRSIDPSTAHGAIIVDKNNKIVGCGYNGAPPDMAHEQIPLERPEKYEWMIHAEENAIFNRTIPSLEGCTIYVTGLPCHRCFARILANRISKCVYGPISYVCEQESRERIEKMNKLSRTPVQLIPSLEESSEQSYEKIVKFLDSTKEYLLSKISLQREQNGKK